MSTIDLPAIPGPAELAPALADLGLDGSSLSRLGDGTIGDKLAGAHGDPPPGAGKRQQVGAELGPGATLLLFLPGPPPLTTLAAWRNALWPLLHVPAWYRFDGQAVQRMEYERQTQVGQSALSGALIVARRRTDLMSPDATVTKFDANAAGWDGEPGGPGYPHFRWMRRYVGCFAGKKNPKSILDFGCGAGWCGIEAALAASQPTLCAFDPSPNMVQQAAHNAHAAGIGPFEGRTGFGEAPPFPTQGQEPFDLVISSGVISFSPDPETWMDGIAKTVAAAGDLVIGDIHRESRGFRARRHRRPVLPARELSALTAAEVESGMASRGFEAVRRANYQITWPVPQLMHLNETRLKGALTYPLLWANQLSAASNRVTGFPPTSGFDSWVLHLRRR
ncbi:MAG TPA: methyltransferase domain-containing protein [Planctomycetes bacterium]|nr:methyltransferase domain-containing protein [Planctomycetota bacterium]HIK59991.1 methyltransferase domain-containing protein [Planctomycetota bacterium]